MRISISALTLRSSALAHCLTTFSSFASILSANAVLSGPDGRPAISRSTIQRAGVDDGTDILVTHEHDQQVRDHRHLPLAVDLEILVLETLQGFGHQIDGALDDSPPGGNDGTRLLATQHRMGDFRCIGKMGDPRFD